MPSAGALLTAQTIQCDTLITDDLKFDTSSFSGWVRHTGVPPIELDAQGMLFSSATPPADHSVEASVAADFGDANFGTVCVVNSGTTDLSSSKHYLVQVATSKMVHKDCPIIVSQVVPAAPYLSGAGTFTGDWRHLTSMACGVIPCNETSDSHFNIWFKPNETIAADSKFWFNWYMPQTSEPSEASATTLINSTLPDNP